MHEKTGYLHPGYARSLREFGVPRELPRSGGWVLERDIPGTPHKDAMGCYPLFACPDWSQLSDDLKHMESEITALSLVTDPFGDYTPANLHQCFKDLVIPFKDHFVVDLSRPIATFVCSHHRRYAQKALQELSIKTSEHPIEFYEEWVSLYSSLIKRHKITGIPAFSRQVFAGQLTVPGIIAFRAMYKESTIGVGLWYVQGDVGYYHLGAYSGLGYEMRASFGLFWSAIKYFAENGLKWLTLGAGAGVKSDGSDGLSAFKRGWSTGTRTTHLCGRIFHHPRYEEMMRAKDIFTHDYFPAYRMNEFG